MSVILWGCLREWLRVAVHWLFIPVQSTVCFPWGLPTDTGHIYTVYYNQIYHTITLMLLDLLQVCVLLRHSRKIKRPGLSSISDFEKCILIIQESHRRYNRISQYVVHTGMYTFAYLSFKCHFCWKLNTKKTPSKLIKPDQNKITYIWKQ